MNSSPRNPSFNDGKNGWTEECPFPAEDLSVDAMSFFGIDQKRKNLYVSELFFCVFEAHVSRPMMYNGKNLTYSCKNEGVSNGVSKASSPTTRGKQFLSPPVVTCS